MWNNVEQCGTMWNNVVASFIKFRIYEYAMRKILAIIGALITGGIGVAVSILTQSAEAALTAN
jgi:hypothetical protein